MYYPPTIKKFGGPGVIRMPELHPHELYPTHYKYGHICDVCNKYNIDKGYRCSNVECQFDYCIDCYNMKDSMFKPKPLFDREPNAYDFYEITITVELDSNYYKEMLNMIIYKTSQFSHTYWQLTAENIEKTIKIVYCTNGNGHKCKNCYLEIQIDMPMDTPLECNFREAGGNPRYEIDPKRRELLCTNMFYAQKKHLNKILHKVFDRNVILTLNGTYIA